MALVDVSDEDRMRKVKVSSELTLKEEWLSIIQRKKFE